MYKGLMLKQGNENADEGKGKKGKRNVKKLESFQRKYLRGVAHPMKPVVFIGQRGITDAVTRSINEALDAHELIKVKFIDHKEKELKSEMAQTVERMNRCELVGMIGHVAIFYRRHREAEKRRIKVPATRQEMD